MWLQLQACPFATVFSSGSQAKQVARVDAHMKPVLRHSAAGSVGGSKEGKSALPVTPVDLALLQSWLIIIES